MKINVAKIWIIDKLDLYLFQTINQTKKITTMEYYEIQTSDKTYKFNIGDMLMMNPKGKTYSHVRPQANEAKDILKGSVPSDVITMMMEQLEVAKKWPLTYKVIGNSKPKKDPKPNDQKLNEIYEELNDNDGLDSIEISQL